MQLLIIRTHLYCTSHVKLKSMFIAMTGKQLFDHYQSIALRNGFGSDEFRYGNLLFEALRIEGEDKVFKLLEEAKSSGKKIGLGYSVHAPNGTMEPDRVIIV